MINNSSIFSFHSPHKNVFRIAVSFVSVVFIFCMLSFSVKANESRVNLSTFKQGTLGKYVHYFQERKSKLSFPQAQHYFANSTVKSGVSHSISLGIGVDPAWMKVTINNDTSEVQTYRLAIETPWLDYIDAWLVNNNQITEHIVGGDAVPFEMRPMQYKFFAFEHSYPPGETDIFLRIESKGPMAIPIRFSTLSEAIKHDISSAYQYGILYGIMLALALYNLVLFLFIKQKEYGLYSLYLIGFLLNSLSYTGQLHTLITPDFGPYFQDWLDIWLMITYSVAGLHFARVLLNTKSYAPNLDKFVLRTTVVIPAGMLLGAILNQLFFSMALAFILNTCFVVLFIMMGISAYKAERPFAIIFLLCSVTAAISITISTLAVAGLFIPYNDYTFKTIEVGMAFEAILLAVILARQFRMARLDKLIAETYARTDTLTQLNNRHGFQEISQPIWQTIVREKRDAAIVLIDIDYFKKFNDQYGHDTGDRVLKNVAQCIANTGRKGDVTARWGGEEFIIFLPETSQSQAALQAERIRFAVEALAIKVGEVPLTITVSIGVSGTENGYFNEEQLKYSSLEPLINQADRALYVAKECGKNLVYAGT